MFCTGDSSSGMGECHMPALGRLRQRPYKFSLPRRGDSRIAPTFVESKNLPAIALLGREREIAPEEAPALF